MPRLHDELGFFYVVTFPTPHCTIDDIMFRANMARMMLQFRGGLDAADIAGIYKNKGMAMRAANAILKTTARP